MKWLRRGLAGSRGLRSKHGANLALDILAANGVHEIAITRSDGRLLHMTTRDKVIASSVIRTGSYGAENMRAFTDLLAASGLAPPDLRFVNVGANIGTTCLNAYEAGFRRFLAVEADPANFALLQRNLEGLAGADVKLVNKAAGESIGRLSLYRHSRNMGAHSLLAPSNGGSSADVIEVAVEPLSSLLAAGQPFALVVDVEGFEPQVLRGAAQALAHDCRAMMLEITPSKYAALDAVDLASRVAGFAADMILVPSGEHRASSELPHVMREQHRGHFDIALARP